MIRDRLPELKNVRFFISTFFKLKLNIFLIQALYSDNTSSESEDLSDYDEVDECMGWSHGKDMDDLLQMVDIKLKIQLFTDILIISEIIPLCSTKKYCTIWK